MNDLLVYIPTLGRENNQITLKSIPEEWKSRVFLVCPKNEEHEWENRIDVPEYCMGSISKTRQFIVENSKSNLVGMMDDDLTFYERDSENLTKTIKLKDIREYLDLMESWLKEGDVYCTQSSTFMSHKNLEEYYYGKPYATHFLNRDYLISNNIRFDTLDYFEDFHVPLSILESGKRLRISGKYIAKERQANADGGCSLNRDGVKNKQAMYNLQKLHPKYITLKEETGAKNQNLIVDLKMRIAFKKAYDENVVSGGLDDFM
jgi:hypothetical protein